MCLSCSASRVVVRSAAGCSVVCSCCQSIPTGSINPCVCAPSTSLVVCVVCRFIAPQLESLCVCARATFSHLRVCAYVCGSACPQGAGTAASGGTSVVGSPSEVRKTPHGYICWPYLFSSRWRFPRLYVVARTPIAAVLYTQVDVPPVQAVLPYLAGRRA